MASASNAKVLNDFAAAIIERYTGSSVDLKWIEGRDSDRIRRTRKLALGRMQEASSYSVLERLRAHCSADAWQCEMGTFNLLMHKIDAEMDRVMRGMPEIAREAAVFPECPWAGMQWPNSDALNRDDWVDYLVHRANKGHESAITSLAGVGEPYRSDDNG